MITRSLWEAINTEQPNLEEVQIAKSVPRVCFLSGLTGEEMMMLIEEFPEIERYNLSIIDNCWYASITKLYKITRRKLLNAGLEPVVFAALVPNSADKLLQEVVEEVIGDHEMMCRLHNNQTQHRQIQLERVKTSNAYLCSVPEF
ncbi:uncharacterized protein LOC113314228 [Papaver somniferum]|uniref:uncharacterized protein LOC113314228 n=1 Tax=Papaver somniferum TaxID=3469 RepID=UPI000E6FBF46|nr:uncharacterized protein LOC113314228 [Papaver somniferum]